MGYLRIPALCRGKCLWTVLLCLVCCLGIKYVLSFAVSSLASLHEFDEKEALELTNGLLARDRRNFRKQQEKERE